MWTVLTFICLCVGYAGGHVRLIYPPARKYARDFMDNIRTPGPCGIPSALGPKTSLLAGSTISVNFHLAYPHRGGYFLEIMNNDTNAIYRHPGTGFISESDTTSRSQSFTLPNEPCSDCTLRLVREAAEWGGSCGKKYLFWSCADVDIVAANEFNEDCSGHGTWTNNACQCDSTHEGDKCQHKVECKTDANCENNGRCITIATTPNPVKQCYCQPGWFGQTCQTPSTVTNATIDYTQYKEREMSPGFKLFYRTIPAESEIEMVLKVNTNSWVAIGWRPQTLQSGCQLFPNIPGLVGTAVPTSEPEAHPETEPEATSEPETEPEATSEPETEPEATSEPETEPEATSEPETTGEPETEPEPENTPCSASWSEGCIAGGCAYKSSWVYDPTSDKITFTLEATLNGQAKWIGIGFSDDKFMANSDAIIGWFENGVPTVKDVWLSGRVTPSNDVTQNIEAVSGSLVNGVTKIEFTRPRDTGDTADKQFSDTNCFYFFYALGGGYNAQAGTVNKHSNTPKVSPNKICIKACAASEPEPEYTAEPETHGEPEPTVEPEGEPEGGGGNCPATVPAPGYSAGGGFRGTSDTTGGNVGHPMDCTDIIIGSANGQLSRVGDYYTRDRSTPKRDVEFGQTESLTAAIGFEENGETTILFRRKLIATERADYTIADALMHVIWAKGQDETNYIHRPASGDRPGFYKHDHLLYHGHSPQRGVQTINFLEKPAKPTSCNGRWPSTCIGCNLEATWVFDAATDSIKFTIKARLNGEKKWIALGFSADTSMPNSDAVVGWIDNGQVTLTDRWMTAKSLPTEDTKNDITGVTGDVINGVTTISFTRKRDTGDTQDFQFTDIQCGYMFYAMGGSYNNDGTFSKHATTPVVSSQKICIRSCDIQPTSPVTLKSEVEVKLEETFDADYLDSNTPKYQTLATAMADWANGALKDVDGFKTLGIKGFRQGSVITIFDVFVEKQSDDAETKAALQTELRTNLQGALTSPPQGYTLNTTYLVVSVPETVVEEPGFKLSLVEEIVIGCAVALVLVCVIVAVCKFSESKRAKAASKHEQLSNSGGSSTSSLTNDKPTSRKMSYDEFMKQTPPGNGHGMVNPGYNNKQYP
ncbi:uncharacterized protein LOC130010296 [Patella vulgata]|uniref:uncharacterized protein LOC130010296 n=1 Tax=Patella vulgata TaxID=6465 RepID=UPI00217F66DB|nr:uncharacterized protein LOC130010296 [Patella vulgata]